MLTRREALLASAGGIAALVQPTAALAAEPRFEAALAPGVKSTAVLDALPGKVPLIKLSYRPPNYETPIGYLNGAFTPNDAFFVRYHLADIPDVDAATWKLAVGGPVATTPFSLTLDELKTQFPIVELAAVCQCSGNRRGLFEPHVPGVQWGYGAIGNALWKGVRLKDVLTKAGLARDALEVVFNGADGPVLDKTPAFVKSLPIAKAIDENTLIAFEMNGAPLPKWNGFPARLVVPGWTATYWMKHVVKIDVVAKPFDGFWMRGAYRIPLGKFPVIERFVSQETAANTPITEMVVNSLITAPADGAQHGAGKALVIEGIAWDGGYGIEQVEVSFDGGTHFERATLGDEAGRFAFRRWSFTMPAPPKGRLSAMARATNKVGQTQTAALIQNPAGYHHNVMHRIAIDVA